MNSLIQLRTEVAEALTDAGIRASEFIPDRITPPIAAVTAGDPYIGPGKTFCDNEVRLDVTVIAAPATNKVATNALDEQIVKTVHALDGWTLESVGQPFALAVNSGEFLAARLTVSTYTEIKEC